MSIQDKLERILREMHLMVSRGQVVETDEEYVLIHKKIMQQQLTNLSEAVNEMMEFYDLTVQGRNRAELEAENQFFNGSFSTTCKSNTTKTSGTE